MKKEKTLVLIKHDGVLRGLIGKILSRFEDMGLKITAMKLIWANQELAKNHYMLDEQWAKEIYEKTKSVYEKENKLFPYKTPIEFGKQIQSWNMLFLTEGPVVAIVVEGPHAIEISRKIIGSTEPRQALPGTIRGDFASVESYTLADTNKRVLRNLIHASDSQKNAEREISLWFSPKEIHAYQKEIDKHF